MFKMEWAYYSGRKGCLKGAYSGKDRIICLKGGYNL